MGRELTDNLPEQTFSALIRGDLDTFQRLGSQLGKREDEETRTLTLAGLMILVDGKWEATTPVAEIRTWVADFRNFMKRGLGEIDPVACESFIVSLLSGNDGLIDRIPPRQRTSTMTLLTFKLAHERNMDDRETRDFLDRVTVLAAG